MTVILESGYTLPGADQPLTHARIAHSLNWQSGGTASATSTASGFFTDGPETSLTYEKWKPTSSSSTWTYTFSGSGTVDYACIGAHDLGTQGCTITVQVLVSAVWTTVGSVALTSDMPVFCIFEPRTATAGRVTISGGTPTIGVIKFGEALQMERPLYGGHSPLDLSRMTTTRSSLSVTGEWLGRTKLRNKFQTTFSWSNLTAAWVRTNWKPLQKAIETEPYFIAWRPDTFSEVGFCYTDQNPVPTNSGTRDLMNVALDATGYGYE